MPLLKFFLSFQKTLSFYFLINSTLLEFSNSSIKFICREDAIHHNISFDHENGTVFSNPRYTLHWEPDLNQREETEKLILPHLAMLVMFD